jgi:iron uptake system EfeUOB component EfeO/EfeM
VSRALALLACAARGARVSRALALLACAALAGGCGASSGAHTRAKVAPPTPEQLAGALTRTQTQTTLDTDDGGSDYVPPAPLTARDFARPVARYRAYSGRQADAMQGDVAALAGALAAGDRASARAAWAHAYGRYLRIGAAYGALGDLDAAIDGPPGHLRGGANDPRFSGLHRIEHGLWRDAPLPSLTPWTTRLARDVRTLRRVVRRVAIPPLDYVTRAHEIMEDAQRDMLSGRAAPWSGAGLQATADSLAATDEVLDTLRPLLGERDSSLQSIDTYASRLARELGRLRRAHGGRLPPLRTLTPAEHERVNGALGVLLEALASIPVTLETQIPPKIPSIASQEQQP